MSMALFSPTPPPPSTTLSSSSPSKPKLSYKPQLTLLPRKPLSLFLSKSATDNGAGLCCRGEVGAPSCGGEEEGRRRREGPGLNGAAVKEAGGGCTCSFQGPQVGERDMGPEAVLQGWEH
ncbi:light-harvesting complex-like protein 3 isotype 1, chloroplastic [Iris pallida]|uniref:Light-harvesting complex-like protein 3 isotype 1, chloroplastic n=1 Tax=Iris pallida TaxID=29817 RepID=A0AAX6IKB2_IRIPA|nr:light-harvesting complex-like protein 3 isotype 1, chloroplastic [Iris pallida]